MRTKLRHLPIRAASGAYILNSGLAKLEADDDTAKRLYASATGAYPSLEKLDPGTFTKLLAAAEVTLGAALLLPVIPSRLAGLGLGAFSGGLVGLYLRTPGMRQEDGVRPTQEGSPLAKDIWLLGIALTLLVDRQGKSKSKRKNKK